MTFHDDPLTADDSYGLKGGSGFNTGIVQLNSGAEERTARWGSALRTFDAARNIRTRATAAYYETFWQARQGSAHTFPYKDWRDYASTADGATTAFLAAGGGSAAVTNVDQTLGTGDGTTKTFQLVKKYVRGAIVRTRNITRPVSGTVLISKDVGAGPVSQTLGVDFTIDLSTGIVTFATAPAVGALIKGGFEYYVPCRFGDSIDKTGIVWHFVDGDQINVESVPIVEVPEGPAIDDEFYYGDGENVGVISASFTVNLGLGRLQKWTVNTASLSATMPNAVGWPQGDMYLRVYNDGSQTIQIKRADGTNEFTIAAGAKALFALLEVSGVNRWYGFGA